MSTETASIETEAMEGPAAEATGSMEEVKVTNSTNDHDATGNNKENNAAVSRAAGSKAAPSASSAATSSAGGDALPSVIDFEPPTACVRRILKNTMPPSTNVGKDALAAFQRSVGIFIIYLTACSNDFARENRRQTITANDVLAAIQELDFDEFTPELKAYLENFRQSEKSKKDQRAKQQEQRQQEVAVTTATPSNASVKDEVDAESKTSKDEKHQNDFSMKTEEEDDAGLDDNDSVEDDDEDAMEE